MGTAEPGSFGELLRLHRMAAGLTQGELAARAGLSTRRIHDLERGLHLLPYADTRLRLTDALGLSDPDRAAMQTLGTQPVVAHEMTAAGTSDLPLKLTSFVGRQPELTEMRHRLEVARLVSLVGTGGIGKTRLALEVARTLGSRYADGVILVDLGPIAAPELVVQAIARALGLRIELDREPQAATLSFLSARELLLVLDNCEHLVGACAELVAALAQTCSGVSVLATSREPLGVDGEVLTRLGPLDEGAGVELFLDRARARRADFDLGDGTAVRRLCLALDFLPLAIELAGALRYESSGILRW
jgi:transcriptional regulator with XRE-family HTH domain